MLALLLALAVQDVDALCRDLRSDDAELREKADAELRRLGRPSLKPLAALLEDKDVEVRGRAKTIFDAIRRRLRDAALKLSVKADKEAYRPGDEITLRATLTNTEDFPVVVPKFIYDGGPSPDAWISVSLDGKPRHPEEAEPLPQVIVHGKVDASRFVTLAPGASIAVRESRFRRFVDTRSKRPANDPGVPPAAPGAYAVVATFAFPAERSGLLDDVKPEFQGGAKALFDEAWRGSLKAETRFEIR